jgi:hypothetical protein
MLFACLERYAEFPVGYCGFSCSVDAVIIQGQLSSSSKTGKEKKPMKTLQTC